MYYELYIDVLFLENFMMDSLLLFSVRKIQKLSVGAVQVLAGALLGAGLTCIVIVLDMSDIIRVIVQYIIIAVLIVKVGLNPKSILEIFRLTILLYIITILYGGILYLFRPYIRYTSMFYMTAVAVYFMVNFLGKILNNCWKEQRNVYKVIVYTSKGTYELQALMDTGNRLTDPISGDPVCVLDQKTAERILEGSAGFRYIPCRTIAGESIMPVIRAERMIVRMKREKEISGPLIGICEEPVSERQIYQMILNPDILGGTKYVS